MQVLIRNPNQMFDVFEKDGQIYMTAMTGGVAMYDVTIMLTDEEHRAAMADEGFALDLARRLSHDPKAFEDRLIRPPIVPQA